MLRHLYYRQLNCVIINLYNGYQFFKYLLAENYKK
jgi:hypothetical protein